MTDKRPPLNDTNNNEGLADLGSLPSTSAVAAFNIDGINNLLETKGFVCYHYKHAYIPDKTSLDGQANVNIAGSNRGFIYYDPRPIYNVPQRFSIEDILTANAVFSQGSVLMNLSLNYIDKKEDPNASKLAKFAKHDIIVFPDITDSARELAKYNPSQPLKLKYKIKAVDRVFDKNFIYECDRDFIINDDGLLIWIDGGKKPSKNAILSIVYYYTPIYIVSNMLHSIRVIPSNSSGHAGLPRTQTYAPQQLTCIPSNLTEEYELTDWRAVPPIEKNKK